MADSFKFELVSPEKLLMSEAVKQVVVPGAEGEFTVLPNHAPVLATLRPGILDIINAQGREHRIYVRGGFAEVGPDALTILAQQAVDVDKLDADKIAQEVKDLEEDVDDAKDDETRQKAEFMLNRMKELQQALQS